MKKIYVLKAGTTILELYTSDSRGMDRLNIIPTILHECYFSPLIIISSSISNGTLNNDFLTTVLAVEPGNQSGRLEGTEIKPIYSKLLIKKTVTEAVESLAPGRLFFGLLCTCLQELRLGKQTHLCFLCCRKQSLILTTVQFALKGTSPTTSSGSCHAGK